MLLLSDIGPSLLKGIMTNTARVSAVNAHIDGQTEFKSPVLHFAVHVYFCGSPLDLPIVAYFATVSFCKCQFTLQHQMFLLRFILMKISSVRKS